MDPIPSSELRVYGRFGVPRPLERLARRRRRLPPMAAIPPKALFLHGERPDLRAAFDLSRTSGREGLVWWYIRHGFRELALKFDAGDVACALALNQPVPGMRQLSFLPVTWLMSGLIDLMPIERRSVLEDACGQERLLSWYFAQGLTQANLGEFLTPDQARTLLAPGPEEAPGGGVTRLLSCIWDVAPQLHARFDGVGDPSFQAWCEGEGAREFPILKHPFIAPQRTPARSSPRMKPFGINLFGHAYGRSGISEDVRMAARALTCAGIPFAVHNVAPGPGMPNEESATADGDALLPYAINLFCMTAEATAAAVVGTGREVIADHYNIGFWPWELPEMPAFWHHAYDFVDEVWASSRFTYDAFCRSSPKRVRHMPFAVVAEGSDGLKREDFGLPAERFLFGFAFDGLSSFARKAPLAAVRAFQQAFPMNDASVGLVIKGLRVAEDPQWRQIRDEVAGDERVHLVTGSLDRGALLDLWRALDCFVSLHRSEGFGRNIAETMLLGKPAIVTGHSGNMDFTRHDTAVIVPCSLRQVGSGEYPYGTGQVWAEPNIADAAAFMRRVVADRSWRETIAAAGQDAICATYAPDRVGASWETVLRSIYEAT